ncbi:hypothetical protein [Cerasicoccus frondis]|uniref:hypothetical protein n=1 Tax=Cerasicoccus frondis TaxID=490090 RepID=UPI002852642B|nr:hypothetical protein [Cerasicoccus frondis]
MSFQSYSIAAISFLLTVLPLSAERLIIDDFDSYANSEQLQRNWNSFGSAASSGPANLEVDMGYANSNAVLFNLNWDAGNNANMRMAKFPADVKDLSRYLTVIVWLRILKESGDFDEPSDSTTLRLAIQGGPDDSIWQTKANYEVKIDFDDYKSAEFSLLDSEMERVSGKCSFNETLTNINNIRLRFENEIEPQVRQDVYIDSILATTSTD